MTEKRSDGSQSLRRGMQLVEFLSDYPNGCPLARIADGTSLNKSTAHRLLKNLHDMGYVTPASTPGSYRLTCKFAAIGHKILSAMNAVQIAAPWLERLNIESGDTVNFSTREGHYCVLVYKLEPTAGLLRTRSHIGQRMQLFCSGMGKVFLAFSPEAFFDAYWEEQKDNIVPYTPNTIVSREVMRQELADIREQGVSYDREENEIGVGCIAAPVFGPGRSVDYALSVSLPMFRMNDERRQELAEMTARTAEAVSGEIGGLI